MSEKHILYSLLSVFWKVEGSNLADLKVVDPWNACLEAWRVPLWLWPNSKVCFTFQERFSVELVMLARGKLMGSTLEILKGDSCDSFISLMTMPRVVHSSSQMAGCQM